MLVKDHQTLSIGSAAKASKNYTRLFVPHDYWLFVSDILDKSPLLLLLLVLWRGIFSCDRRIFGISCMRCQATVAWGYRGWSLCQQVQPQWLLSTFCPAPCQYGKLDTKWICCFFLSHRVCFGKKDLVAKSSARFFCWNTELFLLPRV